jgi:Tfp pilus assembly protein PilV
MNRGSPSRSAFLARSSRTGGAGRGRLLHTRAGFSITEVIVSVLVVTIGVLAFAAAVALASRELRRGRIDTEISLLAADQLERLKTTPYNLVVDGQRDEGDYHLAWTVSGYDAKRVTLVVSYTGPEAYPRPDTLVAYIRR